MPESADRIATNLIQQEQTAAASVLPPPGPAPSETASNVQGQTAQVGSGSSQRNLASTETIKAAQAQLKQEGLYNGRIDGIVGPKTKQALRTFQQQNKLPQTASLNPETLNALNVGNQSGQSFQAAQNKQSGQSNQSSTSASGSSTPSGQTMSADQVRSQLQSDGYSKITDLRRVNDNTYSAHAVKDGSTYMVQVDAQTGRVVSQRQVAGGSNTGTAGTSNMSQGSSSNPNAAPNASSGTGASGSTGGPGSPTGSSGEGGGSAGAGTGGGAGSNR